MNIGLLLQGNIVKVHTDMFFSRIFKKILFVPLISTSIRNLSKVSMQNTIITSETTASNSSEHKKGECVQKIRPLRVSVEGNIGAGKSSLMNHFSKYAGVEIYTEPIEWWRNLEGHNLLHLLYTDINLWYNVFQHYVQLTRLQVQISPPKDGTTVQIFERSVQNNRYCFLEQAHRYGHLTHAEYEILKEWYDWMESSMDIEIDLIVYLRTSPEVVYERMKKRGRTEEETVPFEYMKELHESHEEWLLGKSSIVNKNRLLVIDGDKSLVEVISQCELNKDKILGTTTMKSRV